MTWDDVYPIAIALVERVDDGVDVAYQIELFDLLNILQEIGFDPPRLAMVKSNVGIKLMFENIGSIMLWAFDYPDNIDVSFIRGAALGLNMAILRQKYIPYMQTLVDKP